MFRDSLACYHFNCGFLRKQFADVAEERADHVPVEGLKAPRWIAGHLAEGQWYATRYLGLENDFPLPEPWIAGFAPGSSSTKPYGFGEQAELPPLAELLDYVTQTEHPIAEAVLALPEGSLVDPHGIELLQGVGIDSQADLVGHLMTTHFAFHLGQLSIWRRAMGQPPLF